MEKNQIWEKALITGMRWLEICPTADHPKAVLRRIWRATGAMMTSRLSSLHRNRNRRRYLHRSTQTTIPSRGRLKILFRLSRFDTYLQFCRRSIDIIFSYVRHYEVNQFCECKWWCYSSGHQNRRWNVVVQNRLVVCNQRDLLFGESACSGNSVCNKSRPNKCLHSAGIIWSKADRSKLKIVCMHQFINLRSYVKCALCLSFIFIKSIHIHTFLSTPLLSNNNRVT